MDSTVKENHVQDINVYWKYCIELVEQTAKDNIYEASNLDKNLIHLAQKLASAYKSYSQLNPHDILEFYHHSWTKEEQEKDANTDRIYIVYDGSFAPVHNGHVSTVHAALKYILNYYQSNQQQEHFNPQFVLQLSCVHPSHLHRKLNKKMNVIDASIDHRYAMLKLAFGDQISIKDHSTQLRVEYYEKPTRAPFSTNSFQTLARAISRVHDSDPKNVWFVIGDDALWKLRYQLCLGVNVVIALRSGATGIPHTSTQDIPAHLLQPPHLNFVSPEITNLSSTQIRKYLQSVTSDTNQHLIDEELSSYVQIPSVIEYLKQHRLFQRHPKIIGITGLSGVGKTTLATQILQFTNDKKLQCAHINIDDYFKPHSELPVVFRNSANEPVKYDMDTPDAIDWKRLHCDIRALVVQRVDAVIVEGGHLLCDQSLRDICDKIVYIDGDVEECKNRRLARRVKRVVESFEKNPSTSNSTVEEAVAKITNPEMMDIWMKYWEQYVLPFQLKIKSIALADKDITVIRHSDLSQTVQLLSELVEKL